MYRILAEEIYTGTDSLEGKHEIILEDKKIKRIHTDTNIEVTGDGKQKDSTIIDVRKYTVIPGLIDTHVHIMMNPEIDHWEDWLSKQNNDLLLLNAAANAQNLLSNGVTTVRECGAFGNIAFSLKEAVENKILQGPRLIISGNPITITGGHCHYMGLEADGLLDIRKAIRLLNKRNVDFVKFMATGGNSKLTSTSNRREIQYNLEETRVLVEEAHKRNKKIAAHALGTQGIINSAIAGVDTIEHCTWLDPNQGISFDLKAAKLMVKKNIFVNPCLTAVERYISNINCSNQQKKIVEEYSYPLLKMRDLGVQFLAGTDAGIPGVGFDSIFSSMYLLIKWVDMTVQQAIKASTADAAKALGLENEIGTIDEGKLADMVIIDGNLKDPNNIKVIMVIKEGNIVFNRNY